MCAGGNVSQPGNWPMSQLEKERKKREKERVSRTYRAYVREKSEVEIHHSVLYTVRVNLNIIESQASGPVWKVTDFKSCLFGLPSTAINASCSTNAVPALAKDITETRPTPAHDAAPNCHADGALECARVRGLMRGLSARTPCPALERKHDVPRLTLHVRLRARPQRRIGLGSKDTGDKGCGFRRRGTGNGSAARRHGDGDAASPFLFLEECSTVATLFEDMLTDNARVPQARIRASRCVYGSTLDTPACVRIRPEVGIQGHWTGDGGCFTAAQATHQERNPLAMACVRCDVRSHPLLAWKFPPRQSQHHEGGTCAQRRLSATGRLCPRSYAAALANRSGPCPEVRGSWWVCRGASAKFFIPAPHGGGRVGQRLRVELAGRVASAADSAIACCGLRRQPHTFRGRECAPRAACAAASPACAGGSPSPSVPVNPRFCSLRQSTPRRANEPPPAHRDRAEARPAALVRVELPAVEWSAAHVIRANAEAAVHRVRRVHSVLACSRTGQGVAETQKTSEVLIKGSGVRWASIAHQSDTMITSSSSSSSSTRPSASDVARLDVMIRFFFSTHSSTAAQKGSAANLDFSVVVPGGDVAQLSMEKWPSFLRGRSIDLRFGRNVGSTWVRVLVAVVAGIAVVVVVVVADVVEVQVRHGDTG
ncbi:hypothetical protein B0H10DRAFT_2191615 [Mycena sp. CBHHK59/15]|nr:hypothetical protein B0H10DRAFT_2191615 [Mycena sp. CBHHK59/15]